MLMEPADIYANSGKDFSKSNLPGDTVDLELMLLNYQLADFFKIHSSSGKKLTDGFSGIKIPNAENLKYNICTATLEPHQVIHHTFCGI